MPLWPKSRKGRAAGLALLLLAVSGMIAAFWGDRIVDWFQAPDPALSRILVLADCDEDFRTPPFDDQVFAFDPRGQATPKVRGLNICETIGGPRMLTTSTDGRMFLVCENFGNHLTAYDTQTGARLWRLDGEFTSATVAPDGTTYAVISSGTIYGDQLVVIDQKGEITNKAKLGGQDIVLDPERRVLWSVGSDIKKCALDLTLLRNMIPIPWCAVSLDVNPDGSIWVAERQHSQVSLSSNRLLHVSASGMWITKAMELDFTPVCLRVDRSDGSFWVTGTGGGKSVSERVLEKIEKRTGRLPLGKLRAVLTRSRFWTRTHKYDAEGKLLCKINHGGDTLDIDRTDGSIWIAGRQKIFHYTRNGKRISRFPGVAGDQTHIVVVPAPKP